MGPQRLKEILESVKKNDSEIDLPDLDQEISLDSIDAVARQVADSGDFTGLLSCLEDNKAMGTNLFFYKTVGTIHGREDHNRTLSRYIATLIEAYGVFETEKDFKKYFEAPFGNEGGDHMDRLIRTFEPDASLDILMGPKNIAFYLKDPKLIAQCTEALLTISDQKLREKASVLIGEVAYKVREPAPKIARIELTKLLTEIKESHDTQVKGLLFAYKTFEPSGSKG